MAGPKETFIDASCWDRYLHEMVKMSPLQGSALELVQTSDETAIIGAAVNALRVGNGAT